MPTPRHSVMRDWIALLVILFAVPLSVFGGTNLACVGQGFSSSCALDAVVISPVLLAVAGVVAGLITRGWTGLFVVGVGQILGQFLILLFSYQVGRPVPVDPFSAIIATVWFGAPIAIGYGIARGAVWLAGRRKPNGDAGA